MERESIRKKWRHEYYDFVFHPARKSWEEEHGPTDTAEWMVNLEPFFEEYTRNQKLKFDHYAELLKLHRIFQDVYQWSQSRENSQS